MKASAFEIKGTLPSAGHGGKVDCICRDIHPVALGVAANPLRNH